MFEQQPTNVHKMANGTRNAIRNRFSIWSIGYGQWYFQFCETFVQVQS